MDDSRQKQIRQKHAPQERIRRPINQSSLRLKRVEAESKRRSRMSLFAAAETMRY